VAGDHRIDADSPFVLHLVQVSVAQPAIPIKPYHSSSKVRTGI
jgi:hypothetical protein